MTDRAPAPADVEASDLARYMVASWPPSWPTFEIVCVVVLAVALLGALVLEMLFPGEPDDRDVR